jgi:hypothetical protein
MNESPGERIIPHPHGSRNGKAKLDEDQVEVIRENANMPARELAAFFGVTPRNINYICNRATWTHI